VFAIKHRFYVYFLFFLSSALVLTKCKSTKIYSSPLGIIKHPSDNEFSAEKVALGKKLFFDKRLSLDESISCSSCHLPELAFSDGKDVSIGVFGRKTMRNAPSLLNSGHLPKLMFDGELPTLEMQVIVPIQEHTEMAMDMKKLILKLRQIPEYQTLAKKIFDRDFDPWVLTRSIAAYERTLISDDSAFDKFYYKKQKNALSKDAKAGWKIFSEKLYCIQCHTLPYFTNFKTENNGYTPLNSVDLGRFRIHSDSSDIGKFKVPSLRNISITAPYMHDGKIKKLEDIIDFYAKGGNKVYNQNEIIKPFEISETEKSQLIEFLKSLSDY
jgi:cytochrome c peroxidase